MLTSKYTSRVAAAGATAALAAGTVLVAMPAADAKPASLKSSYTCDTALGAQTMAITAKLDTPNKVKKGKKVGDRAVKMTVVIPESLVTPMRDVLGIEKLSGEATAIKYAVGSKKLPLKNVKFPETDVPDSGSMTVRAKGVASGFKLKKPGKYAITIPKSFTLNAYNQNGDPVPTSPFPCSRDAAAPSKIDSIKVVK